MGFYDLYRTRVQCSKTDSELLNDDITAQKQDDFSFQPNYYSVYKNFTPGTTYDVIIGQGDRKDKNVGYKMLLSYPYDTFVFDSGDYIHWTHDGITEILLMKSLDKQYLHNATGRVYTCNNSLDFLDEYGNTQSWPCVIEYPLTDTVPDINKNINLPNGIITVMVQSNDYTENIGLNKRFLFGNNGVYNPYKVQSVQNMVDENLIIYKMQYDYITDYDDTTLGIADKYRTNYVLSINQDNFQQSIGYTSTLTATLKLNDEVVTEDLIWSSSNTSIATINATTGVFTLIANGSVTFTCKMADNLLITDTVTVVVTATPSTIKENRISPNVTELLQGDKQTYTVYSYTNNVANSNTFTITASGVPTTGYYLLNIISGNSFEVKNLVKYVSDLVITCTNNSDATTETISIKLKGVY